MKHVGWMERCSGEPSSPALFHKWANCSPKGLLSLSENCIFLANILLPIDSTYEEYDFKSFVMCISFLPPDYRA